MWALTKLNRIDDTKLNDFKECFSQNIFKDSFYGAITSLKSDYDFRKHSKYAFYIKDFVTQENSEWQSTKYQFSVLNKKYSIDRKLSHIAKSIEESVALLELKDDWDDFGALSTDKNTFLNSIKLLLDYSENALLNYNVLIEQPEISVVKDGSIDLEWRNSNAILLLNILKNEKFEMHFYGEDLNSSVSMKGILKDKSVNKDLLHWFQKF